MSDGGRRLRRGTVVLTVLAALVVLPAVAWATFRVSVSPATGTTVGTAGLAASGLTVTTTTSGACKATLTWTGNSYATSYRVVATPTGTNKITVNTLVASSPTVVDLTKNTAYAFSVTAIRGTWSAQSNTVNIASVC